MTLLTTTDAARLVRVTRPTIIKWLQSGRLIPYQTEPTILFDKRAVEKAAVNHVPQSTPGRPKKSA